MKHMKKRNIMIALKPVDRSFIERFTKIVWFIEAIVSLIKKNAYVRNKIIEEIESNKGEK